MNSDNTPSNENNPIFDIIQNLQSKLNNPEPTYSAPEDNQNTTYQPTSNGPSEFNFNKLTEILNGIGMNQSPQTNENSNVINNIASNLSNLNIDFNTIMKFQRFFTSLNKNDPRKNLLTSLKPFMRETRQKNVDTYITLIGVINALDIFNNKGSE